MQSSSTNSPDSLQDLCIFYCVENLPSLNIQTVQKADNSYSDTGGGDAITSPDQELPVTLCDKLVAQFLKTCIPESHPPPYSAVLHNLLKRKNVCSKLNLLRHEILAEANICDISNSHITGLNLFGCSEYSYSNSGIALLLKQNKGNIKNLRVYGIFGSLDDIDDSPYYSFLPDPGDWSITGPSGNASPTDKGDGEIIFSIRGDFNANQRFLVYSGSISKPSTESDTLTLLYTDGCYRQTNDSADKNWYSFPNLTSFTAINTDSISNIPSDLIIWNILASNHQLTTVCIVSVDVSFWWTKITKLQWLTTLILSSNPRQAGNPIPFFEHLAGLENLRYRYTVNS